MPWERSQINPSMSFMENMEGDWVVWHWRSSVCWTKVPEPNHGELKSEHFRIEAGCEVSPGDGNWQLGQLAKNMLYFSLILVFKVFKSRLIFFQEDWNSDLGSSHHTLGKGLYQKPRIIRFWPFKPYIWSLHCSQTHLCIPLAWKHLGIITSNILCKEMSRKEN